MPLETDSSIVADSTLSSSPLPPPMQRDPDASMQIKRSARTYGRRQEAPLVETPEIPSSFPSSSSSFSTHNTAPPGLSEEIPPTSPQTQPTNYDTTLNSDEDDENASNASPKFTFGWKAKMLALDEESDTETPVDSAAPTSSNGTAGFGRPFLLEEHSTGLKSTSLEADTIARSACVTSNDLFRDQSLSQGEQSSSQVPPSRDAFVLSSPKVAPPTRKRLSKVVHDSDSEPEPSKASSSTSPSSSSQLIHPINTPKSRSLTTTPPTSDDEFPMKISCSAGRRKANTHLRPSVPPLELVEGLPSEPRTRTTSKNKPKVKAMTKKEKAEMAKERSRMAAGSNASTVLSRGTLNNYTKEGLFAKLYSSIRSYRGLFFSARKSAYRTGCACRTHIPSCSREYHPGATSGLE
ncbi:hypothetical protein HYPSUDRAFT_478388 [Hypholoma sublateritium FD-334 SS-4]|uniref:Uncharacterized protein n=1 Tax=Hypholoma sublateritium (strain FD-334 SS-4) TaxID=945553 RepID=A0A0D2LBI3_HYPSF|nr:hypothetical protein HYPSUDRAFT_478388 [Hypholoma sublateritium FD-334 SS-4]